MGERGGNEPRYPEQLYIGFTRLLFPFFGGVLLCRIGKLIHIKNAFWWSSLLIIIMLSIPRIGGEHHVWMNGIYESVCLIIVFPLIVSIGAGGELHNMRSEKICTFLGEISYPLYITHYPLIYLFTAWVVNNKVPLGISGLLMGLLVVITSLAIAYLSLRFYDKPVRAWLRNKLLVKKINS